MLLIIKKDQRIKKENIILISKLPSPISASRLVLLLLLLRHVFYHDRRGRAGLLRPPLPDVRLLPLDGVALLLVVVVQAQLLPALAAEGRSWSGWC